MVLAALFLIPLLAMVAFAVDYGYLVNIQTELQRSADAAALAAVQDLIPEPDGNQDLLAAETCVQSYAADNIGGSFSVPKDDIEMGQYDPAQIYSQVVLMSAQPYDGVRVLLRRDSTANAPVPLFFARAVGIDDSPLHATAAAILQKATWLEDGADVLPFAVPEDVWDTRGQGESWSIYGDGQIKDAYGGTVPGNWGTLDIGSTNNSTSDLGDQMVNGLDQSHLDHLYADGRIPDSSYIDAGDPVYLQGDTGLSGGMRSYVEAIHGQRRIVPIYDTMAGGGDNTSEYHVIRWGVVEVEGSEFHGQTNTYVTIKKAYSYMGDLRPQSDLSNTVGVIEGAFTVPALIQ